MTQQAAAPAATLFERVGGEAGLRAIVNDVVDAHLANPLIQVRFQQYPAAQMKENAYAFFAQGTGGPAAYTGRGLVDVHRGMNINEVEFVAACDDLLAVLQARGVGEREQQELLAAFFAMKGEVLHR